MNQGIALTLLSLLMYGVWGFSYKLLSIKQIQGEWVVALIMLFGSLISASLALARSDPFPLLKVSGSVPLLLLAAASGSVGNILLVRAMASPGMSSGVALAISGAYPLVAGLLAYFFLAERLTGAQVIGTAMIVFGVGVLTFKQA